MEPTREVSSTRVAIKRGKLTKRNAAKRRKTAMVPELARVKAELEARIVKATAV